MPHRAGCTNPHVSQGKGKRASAPERNTQGISQTHADLQNEIDAEENISVRKQKEEKLRKLQRDSQGILRTQEDLINATQNETEIEANISVREQCGNQQLLSRPSRKPTGHPDYRSMAYTNRIQTGKGHSKSKY